jgi:hypothetical protein
MCASLFASTLQEFEKSLAQMLAAASSLLMVVTSCNRALFASRNLTGRSMEIQQLASEDAEKMIWQSAASDTPKAVVAELAALCGNMPIALLVVSSYIANSASAAKVHIPQSVCPHVYKCFACQSLCRLLLTLHAKASTIWTWLFCLGKAHHCGPNRLYVLSQLRHHAEVSSSPPHAFAKHELHVIGRTRT